MKKLQIKATLIAALLAIAGQAQAVPELRETRGDFNGEMVTIYPDHQDPNVFYFLPNSSAFAVGQDNVPLVGLTAYGLKNEDPADGGGVLSFVLRAGLTPEIKAELNRFKQAHPGARLTVVPFGKSFIQGPEAETWKTLAAAIELPKHAGVAETEVGVNMLLTEPGAKVFKGIIGGGRTPFNVQLCFEIYGTLPSMDAKVRINYEKIYQHFSTTMGGRAWFWKWEVRAEVEKLIENGNIHIEILGGDAKFEDYVTSLTDEMIRTYMKPSLENRPTSPGSGNFTFNATYREERKEVNIRVTRKQFVTDDRCVPLSFRDLARYKDRLITEVD